MNEHYEQEIDLKWLLYRVLRSWRMIAVFAIVLAIAVGGVKLAMNLERLTDPEYVATKEANYARAHASWVATGENLEKSMENLADEQQKQQEYTE